MQGSRQSPDGEKWIGRCAGAEPQHIDARFDSLAGMALVGYFGGCELPVASLAFASHSRGGSADALESAGSLVRGFPHSRHGICVLRHG